MKYKKYNNKKIISQLKDDKAVIAWRIKKYIFSQDEYENGEFHEIVEYSKIIKVKEWPIKIKVKGEIKEFEGCDFMDNGKIIFCKG